MLKNRTKLMFAAELQRMLATKTLDAIRITELCRRCETIPQTFYYHFHDKYELVAWIFLHDFFQSFGGKTTPYTVVQIISGLTKMADQRAIYLRAYTDHAQDAISQCIQQFVVHNAVTAVTAIEHTTSVSAPQLLAIKYFSYGMTGLLTEWLRGSDDLTIRVLAKFQFDNTPKFLKRAYQQFDFSS